jgi:lipoprotein-anchoring transpeptidase ErfK/SrfK
MCLDGKKSVFRLLLGGAILILICACQELPPPMQRPLDGVLPTRSMGWFDGAGISGSPRIVVRIGEQKAYFYKGRELVGESTVSTGKPGFSTPPGSYQVVSKSEDHVSTVFGDYIDDYGNIVRSNIDRRKDRCPPGAHFDGARMPYAMFFRSGYAMHQGYVPPYAASHGCIRLPDGMAERFYDAAPVGTPVVVKE